MEYYFTKRVIVDGPNNGFINTGKYHLFSVYNTADKLVGEVYCNAWQGFFNIGEIRMKVMRAGERLFQRMCIVDACTDKIVGEYRHDGWKSLRNGGTILLNDQRYAFQKLSVFSSLFDRDTWGYYKYQIRREGMECTYSFHIDPTLSRRHNIIDKAFEGVVEVTGVLEADDLVVLFAGFYFLDSALQNELSI